MSEQAYPTRNQAERIASSECDTELCHECDIMRWCTSDTMDPTSASRACGASMLAMHDEIDRLRSEIDRLNGMRHYADGVPGYTPNGSNVSQAQLDKIHFDRMQDWGD